MVDQYWSISFLDISGMNYWHVPLDSKHLSGRHFFQTPGDPCAFNSKPPTFRISCWQVANSCIWIWKEPWLIPDTKRDARVYLHVITATWQFAWNQLLFPVVQCRFISPNALSNCGFSLVPKRFLPRSKWRLHSFHNGARQRATCQLSKHQQRCQALLPVSFDLAVAVGKDRRGVETAAFCNKKFKLSFPKFSANTSMHRSSSASHFLKKKQHANQSIITFHWLFCLSANQPP